MIQKIFCVYDSKSEAYLQPFFMKTVGEAVRAITDVVNTPDHTFNNHAADYTLFEVGTFDSISAKFTMLPTPHSINVLLELKKNAS